MSDNARPELEALEELQRLLLALSDEMVVLRRRAQQAEARVRELEDGAGSQLALGSLGGSNGDAEALARENEMLRARLETARERTRGLLERMRFLRQQHESGAER